MKALIIIDKYSCNNPSFGPSNLIDNVVGSFNTSGLGECHTMYITQDQLWSNEDVDMVLMNVDYDFAFIYPHYTINANIDTIAELVSNGKKIGMCWCDATLMRREPHPSYHWWEYAKVCPQFLIDIGHVNSKEKNIHPISPLEDDAIFNTDDTTEEYDVVFAGCMLNKANRLEYVHYVKSCGINIIAAGGRGESRLGYGNLTTEEYVSLIKKSKISLNFNGGHGGGFPKIRNGRTWETIACGKALISDGAEALYSEENGNWLEPHKEFVPFDGPQDLVKQIQYLLDNEDYRKTIASNGYKRYVSDYSSKAIWTKITNILGVGQ